MNSPPQKGRPILTFLRNKGCFVTFQTVILILVIQAIFRYVGTAPVMSGGAKAFLAFLPRSKLSLAPIGLSVSSQNRKKKREGGVGVGGARGGQKSKRALLAPEVPNTIFTPQCSHIEPIFEEQYKGIPAETGGFQTTASPYLLDISVATECYSRTRRDTIRKGWGSFAKSLGIRYRFFVGQKENDRHCDASLSAESRRFNDIVTLPLIDSYENLTQKVMGMMTYTGKCGQGLFYAKCDDDVFVYPWRLQNRLIELLNDSSVQEYKMGVYMGNFWIDSRPIKEEWHKNHEGRYAGGYFPPDAGGPFYVLSRPAVKFVQENAARLNSKRKNEDMAVGTWMTGADVKIVQEWKIKLLNWKHHEQPYLAEHAVDTPDGVEVWHMGLHVNFSFIGK